MLGKVFLKGPDVAAEPRRDGRIVLDDIRRLSDILLEIVECIGWLARHPVQLATGRVVARLQQVAIGGREFFQAVVQCPALGLLAAVFQHLVEGQYRHALPTWALGVPCWLLVVHYRVLPFAKEP